MDDPRRERLIRIGLVGGESTGKSTLAAHLTAGPGAVVASEALREFVDRTGRTPRIDEQRGIMREQINRTSTAIADAIAQGCALVLSDPAPLMTAVYSAIYFADDTLTPDAIEHTRQTYDLLLWCRPDLPWTPDGPQRDGPADRARADEALSHLLPGLQVTVSKVTGVGDARTRNAIDAIAAARRRLA